MDLLESINTNLHHLSHSLAMLVQALEFNLSSPHTLPFCRTSTIFLCFHSARCRPGNGRSSEISKACFCAKYERYVRATPETPKRVHIYCRIDVEVCTTPEAVERFQIVQSLNIEICWKNGNGNGVRQTKHKNGIHCCYCHVYLWCRTAMCRLGRLGLSCYSYSNQASVRNKVTADIFVVSAFHQAVERS